MKKALENLTAKQKNSIFTVVAITIVSLLIISIFQYTKHSNTEKMINAANDYQKAIISFENSKKTDGFNTIIADYPTSAYAIFSSWYLADNAINTSSVANGTLDLTKLSVSGKGNYTTAAKILEKSIKDNPDNSLTNITKTRLARVYLELNQADNAIKTLQSAEVANASPYVKMLLGDAYVAKGDNQKAIASYEDAKELTVDTDLQNLIAKKLNSIK